MSLSPDPQPSDADGHAPPEVVNAVAPVGAVVDPRAVPVAGVDSDLPAVPAERLSAAALRARFAAPPVWSAEVRREPRQTRRSPAPAAVLVPIVQRAEPMVLLTERATRMSTHSGQIAFPGGRVDPGDASIADAALREAWEEVGLEAGFVEVLGELPTYTTITAFVVTPVVALVQPGFVLRPNPAEVADVFEVPLAFLMDPAHHRRHRVDDGSGQSRHFFSMPYDDHGRERYVWGATAGMLRNLYRFLSA